MFINFGAKYYTMSSNTIADIRQDYIKHALSKESTAANPIEQFNIWFNEAMEAEVKEVNSMTLSTVSDLNRPSSRIVLLKGVEEGQFIFYTNYQSNKGRQIESNPYVSLNFFWHELERQVCIEGKAVKVDTKTSSSYFESRPRASQIGAHTSPQSTPVTNRTILEERFAKLTQEFGDAPIERPAQWGGYAVFANKLEFWQGRASRLHDRILYSLDEDNQWSKVRLAP